MEKRNKIHKLLKEKYNWNENNISGLLDFLVETGIVAKHTVSVDCYCDKDSDKEIGNTFVDDNDDILTRIMCNYEDEILEILEKEDI